MTWTVNAAGSGPVAVGDRARAIQYIGTYYNVYESSASGSPITPTLQLRMNRLLDRHTLFGGRDAQLHRLDGFASTQATTPYLFVTARSGFGKTALLANWVRRAGVGSRDVCYQFISGFDDSADEDFTFRNLCQQLARFHGLQGTLPPTVGEIRTLYSQLLGVPPPAGKNVVVVLDGLDESLNKNWAPGPDLFPRTLPRGVRVIFSARAIANTDWLTNLEIPRTSVEVLELDTLGFEEVRGLVEAAADGQLDWALEPAFLNKLFEVSGGDPFFLRYLVQDIRDVPIRTVDELDQQPRGLKAYLDRWWADVTAQVGEEAARDLLGYLLVAKGSILRQDLLAISPTDHLNSVAFDRTIPRMRRYVYGDDQSGYSLCHPRFQEYVARERIPSDEQLPYQLALLDFCKRWPEHRSTYALRYIASHLVDVARGSPQPARQAHVQELIDLVTSSAFQVAHQQTCADALGLEADLDRAVASAAANDSAEAIRSLVHAALARVAFGQDLTPRQVFETAAQGDLNEAERHLQRYSLALDWNRAVLLMLSWLAADRNPLAAKQLRDQVIGGLASQQMASTDDVLPRLASWLAWAFDGAIPPTADLPEPPSWMPAAAVANTIIARLGGQGEHMLPSGGMELLGRGLSEQMVGTGFLAETDAPMLVALAVQDSTGGADQHLERYLELHATNAYTQYRNGSLWQILRAVLKHPDPAWVRRTARAIAEAALTEYRVDFREGLALALVASRMRFGDPAAMNLLYRLRHAAGPNTDPWAAEKRRKALLAEIFASLAMTRDSEVLLARLPGGIESFAGFQAPACVAIAQAQRVCHPGDATTISGAFTAALAAAQNIQAPTFCARTTAQLNALKLELWASGPNDADLPGTVSRFVRNPLAADFAPVHIVGEQFDLRLDNPTKVPLPPFYKTAQTLTEIAHMYDVKLVDVLELNRYRYSVTDVLPPGVFVAIPDPECAPLVATHLAAQIAADAALADVDKARLLAQLVPVTVSNPTTMDTVLARLILSLRLADFDLIRTLENLVARYPIGGPPDPDRRVYLSIDYVAGQLQQRTGAGDQAATAPAVLNIGVA